MELKAKFQFCTFLRIFDSFIKQNFGRMIYSRKFASMLTNFDSLFLKYLNAPNKVYF